MPGGACSSAHRAAATARGTTQTAATRSASATAIRADLAIADAQHIAAIRATLARTRAAIADAQHTAATPPRPARAWPQRRPGPGLGR